MSKFTKEMVDDYASKLLIGLTDKENKTVLKEFDIIEANMDLIANMPGIENIEPMTHAIDDFTYELRDDEDVSESVPINELLQNCDSYEDREISVPKVV